MMASTSLGVIDVIIAAMAKAELHVHLEGSIDAEALMEIEPGLTRAEIETNTVFDTFDGFLRAYVWVNRKLKTPEHYAIAARHLFERFVEQGIEYAEVTLSAGMVVWKEQVLAQVYDALWRESLRAKVKVFWIPDATRQFGVEQALEIAKFAVSRRDEGVVAFGIGGDEVRGPAEWFKDVFAYARDHGLHLVCHAGETAGPESVWSALEIGAERPIRVLYEAGVPITLNTDDPALFATTLRREYEIAGEEFGLTGDELRKIGENGFRYRFVPGNDG